MRELKAGWLAGVGLAIGATLLLVLLAGAGLHHPQSGAAAAPNVWFLGLANDEFTEDNDIMLTAIKRWFPWSAAPADHFVVKDNLTGPQVLAELEAMRPKVKDGDIFLFHYSGHTAPDDEVGLPRDPDGDESGANALTPQDEVMQAGDDPADWIRDDVIGDKLRQFSTLATKVAVLSTCHAGGYAFTAGSRDLQFVMNIAVYMSVPELVPCPGDDPFQAGLFDALLTDRKADADGNGSVFAREWYDVGKAFDTAAALDPKYFSNLDGFRNIPIFYVSPVGGVAEPVTLSADAPASSSGGSGPSEGAVGAMAGGAAAAALAVAGRWYARRRWVR
ncbi:MAG TPA: hypothetical protein VFT91_08255 [Dehalococcoidia bacterium]|nr:hypothetical protein [Dehalococcoidia bacterium]